MPHVFPRKILLAALLSALVLSVLNSAAQGAGPTKKESGMKQEIVFAGGCFWGVQEYFSRVPGVVAVVAGYAQSRIPDPTYRQVCSGDTGAAEAVRITFDPERVPLAYLARRFFRIIDPLSLNRQGNDRGTQYRTGMYYSTPGEEAILREVMEEERKKYDRPLAVELARLENFYPAEDYHQDYLKNNPGGYCHISFASLDDPDLVPPGAYVKPSREELRKRLAPETFRVTQENGTERPFTGEYWDFDQRGIYVDAVSGEPLFSSEDKFHSACGWPSFSAPISGEAIVEKPDHSHGMNRVEVRSRDADSHLGHVFTDGPADRGGLRYCINSAAIRFIPESEMAEKGYGSYLPLKAR